jgi:hypothetical protein
MLARGLEGVSRNNSVMFARPPPEQLCEYDENLMFENHYAAVL